MSRCAEESRDLTPDTKSFSVLQGDPFDVEFVVLSPQIAPATSGVPADITGATFSGDLVSMSGGASIQMTYATLDAANGLAVSAPSPVAWASALPGVYKCDVRMHMPASADAVTHRMRVTIIKRY